MTEPLPVYTGPRKQLYETSTPQALVIFGALAPRIERNSRESFARTLLDNVLNDSFTGRLFTEVREKRGLVYSVSTGYRLNRLCGSYLGSFGSANETAAAALEATLDVLRRTVADGPTEAELGTLKSAAAGRYLLDIEGRNNLVALMAGLQLNGLPIDFHETYVARMRDVTAAEVGDVARKLIKPDQFSIVVVGKPSPAINLL